MNPQKKNHTIGIRIPQWFSKRDSILQGILLYIKKHEVEWHIDMQRNSDGEMPEVIIDENWNGDGIISFRYSDQEITNFRQKSIKMVNVSSVSMEQVHEVRPDNIQGGELAAKHLIQNGLKDLLFIGRSDRQYSEDRKKGFVDACITHGLEPDTIDYGVNELPPEQRSAFLETHLRKLFPKLKSPMGIFATDDLMGENILRVARLLNINVPDDLAVIGFSNNPLYCLSTSPSLSSIEYPGSTIGYKAAKTLDLLLQKKEQPLIQQIPVEHYKMRLSTNTFAYHGESTKKAIEFIRENAPKRQIKTAEICAYAGVSQSSLKNLMNEALNRSAKKEIDQIRISKLKEYLANTDMSIGEISYSMGFKASEEASRFFKKMTDITPTEYRKTQR